MKPPTKKILSIALLLAILAFAIFYISNNREIFSTIELVNPIYLIFLIAIFIFNYFLIGVLNNSLMFAADLRLRQEKI